MSRNEHGAYGARYEVSTDAPVAGGHPMRPPHTGVEHPMASAPHTGHAGARTTRTAPSFPAMLTFLAVLLGVLAMFWPSYRLRQDFGSDGELVSSFWIHGATSIRLDESVTTIVRPIGLLLFILVTLGAVGAALVAWAGRSVRADALGLLGAAVFAGAMLVPSFMALGADVGTPSEVQLRYGAGVWLGILSSVSALIAAVLFFTQLGRRSTRRIHD